MELWQEHDGSAGAGRAACGPQEPGASERRAAAQRPGLAVHLGVGHAYRYATGNAAFAQPERVAHRQFADGGVQRHPKEGTDLHQ